MIAAAAYLTSNKAFLYSLFNINGYQPIKLNLTGVQNQYAIFAYSAAGPHFGLSDIRIYSHASTNNNSYTKPSTYQIPPGCKKEEYCNFFAANIYDTFLINDVEVFYEIV